MEQILSSHQVQPPLTPGEKREIEAILKEAREHFRKNDLISSSEWKQYMQTLQDEGRA
jgi:hypothetical protein